HREVADLQGARGSPDRARARGRLVRAHFGRDGRELGLGGLDETWPEPSGRAVRPEAASSVGPIAIHYWAFLRPCLGTAIAPRRRARFRQTLLLVRALQRAPVVLVGLLVRDDLRLAVLLGAVERFVGPLEEGRRVVLLPQLRDPGRDGEPPRLADWPRADRPEQPVVELVGVAGLRLGQDHGELIAAHATGDVCRAHDVFHALGRLGQHGVTGQVA